MESRPGKILLQAADKFGILPAANTYVDPVIASLFATSFGPIKKRPNPSNYEQSGHSAKGVESLKSSDILDTFGDQNKNSNESPSLPADDATELHSRKRKRREHDDHLEATYLGRLAREEEQEETARRAERREKRLKSNNQEDIPRRRHIAQHDQKMEVRDARIENTEQNSLYEVEEAMDISQHESQIPSKNESELEKASRTVFLSNVSISAITSKTEKAILIKHLSSFLPGLAQSRISHKLESLRFRSTAFSSSVPKRAAFARKDLMDATTRSTNAYAVYSTSLAAKEAAKQLNGSIILARHLRIDRVSDPAPIVNRRCVFVGNLSYVDDESQIKEAQARESGMKKPKKKPPADVEEGLWQHFGKAGTVESVRVVRDPKTRVGKGFAYVQFTHENAVEAALLLNDQKFPPLLPRRLRVVRAKKYVFATKRNAPNDANAESTASKWKALRTNNAQSTGSNAIRLLGRAGAAKLRSAGTPSGFTPKSQSLSGPNTIVFEGHRASNKQGKNVLRLGKSGSKKKGRPSTRSAKRGATWKNKARDIAKK